MTLEEMKRALEVSEDEYSTLEKKYNDIFRALVDKRNEVASRIAKDHSIISPRTQDDIVDALVTVEDKQYIADLEKQMRGVGAILHNKREEMSSIKDAILFVGLIDFAPSKVPRSFLKELVAYEKRTIKPQDLIDFLDSYVPNWRDFA